MNLYSERLTEWAIGTLKRFQVGKMSGSVTIYFQEGLVQDSKIELKEKPPFDKLKNKL